MTKDEVTEKKQELEALLRQTQTQQSQLAQQEQRVIGALALLEQIEEMGAKPVTKAKK